MEAKHIKPENIPVDLTAPLSPTQAFYIQHNPNDTHIIDVSSNLPSIFSPPDGVSIEAATSVINSTVSTPVFVTKKENLLGTHVKVVDGSGAQVAEMKSPILSLHMGSTTIEISKRDENGGEKEILEIKPLGVMKRTETFIKNGVTYLWEFEHHKHEHKYLYKIIEVGEEMPISRKSEIARYVQANTRTKNGVLILDSREVDALLGILTICAVLGRLDSFTK